MAKRGIPGSPAGKQLMSIFGRPEPEINNPGKLVFHFEKFDGDSLRHSVERPNILLGGMAGYRTHYIQDPHIKWDQIFKIELGERTFVLQKDYENVDELKKQIEYYKGLCELI